MHAITFYRHPETDTTAARYEYNIFDNTFSTSNLVVRKVWMAMLSTFEEQLTHVEVEYNDAMLLEKLGGRAKEILSLLVADNRTIRENKSGEVVVSRTFRSEWTPERAAFFRQISDLSLLPHYRLYCGEEERIIYYFHQYLSIRLYESEEQRFFAELQERKIPFAVR